MKTLDSPELGRGKLAGDLTDWSAPAGEAVDGFQWLTLSRQASNRD